MLKIKAFTALNAYDVVTRKYGRQAVERMLERMPGESRLLYEKGAHKDEWLPLSYYTDFLTAFVDELYDGDIKKAQEVGYLETSSAFKGIYRFFVRLGPNIMARIGALYWRQVYSAGRLELYRNEPNHMVFRLHLDEPIPPINCQEILGSFRAGVEESGGKLLLAEHTLCSSHGHPYCEFRLELV